MNRAVTGIVVLPKEGNVAEFVRENFDIGGLSVSVRVTKAWSEDIPAVVDSLDAAVGLTGEDYAEDYNLSKRRKTVEVVELYPWYNREFLFGYPALCLLGPKEGSLEDIPKKRLRDVVNGRLRFWLYADDDELESKRLRVCVNSKWRNIAEAYLKKEIEVRKGYIIDSILSVKGETEERFRDGGIDLVVEVVCKGNGAITAGLKPYDMIFLNRGVVAIAKKTI